MGIEEARLDLAMKGKKGMHFIIASIYIWTGVLLVWRWPIESAETKNLITFCITTPLMPLAFFISKLIKSEFTVKDNPLNKLGLLFSLNQMLYIVIAMWIYPTVPEKMVMVLAIIFGAHLLPFGWLYKSMAYYVMSVLITVSMVIIGIIFDAVAVAGTMVAIEIFFTVWLYLEVKLIRKKVILEGTL